MPYLFAKEKSVAITRIKQLLRQKPVTIIFSNPVMGRADECNKNCHTSKTAQTEWQPGMPLMVFSNARFQDVDFYFPRHRVIYEFMDTAYYIVGHKFQNTKDIDQVVAVSSSFNPLGRTIFPWGDGYAYTTADGLIA